MDKKTIILKTHGLRNASEVGLVILPESFYVKVHVSLNGDFDVEFINSSEEQLFSVCHSVKCKVEREPSKEEIQATENRTAGFIVDSLAKYLLDDTRTAYDTEENLDRWAAQVGIIFKDFEVLNN